MTEGDDRSRRDHGRLILGVLLIAAGAVWLADAAGASIPWAALLPLVLVAVGLVLMTGKAAGARGALIAVGIAISLVLAARASIPGVVGFSVVGDGVGERAERPTEVAELLPAYRLGIGQAEVRR